MAIGMIEVKGIVALVAGLDEMCKTARVECLFVERVSNGYLVAAIRGELAAVHEALDAAQVVISQHGELRRAQAYAQLHPEAAAALARMDTRALAESVGSSTSVGPLADAWDENP